jgi:hypothetical protein
VLDINFKRREVTGQEVSISLTLQQIRAANQRQAMQEQQWTDKMPESRGSGWRKQLHVVVLRWA